MLLEKMSKKRVGVEVERILRKLENLQWQRCARAAPWSPVNLLTHTGSIMSLPPSSHSSSLLSRAPSLPSHSLAHQSRFSFHSLPPSSHPIPSLPALSPFRPSVFLFCISQQSPGRALALHISTRSCSARLSTSPSINQFVIFGEDTAG